MQRRVNQPLKNMERCYYRCHKQTTCYRKASEVTGSKADTKVYSFELLHASMRHQMASTIIYFTGVSSVGGCLMTQGLIYSITVEHTFLLLVLSAYAAGSAGGGMLQ